MGKQKAAFWAAPFVALALCACGGSGGSSSTQDPAPPADTAHSAAGFWTGTTQDNRELVFAVLDNGEFWGLYTHADPHARTASFSSAVKAAPSDG